MENRQMVNGILLVDKPADWTSHDVVGKVRGILKKEAGQKVKVGHTGTLDPFATGLLILVVGSYTKRAGEFSGMDKTYEAEMILGATSTTGDPEGELSVTSHQSSAIHPSLIDVEAVFKQFEGVQMQMPHKYSAKKVGGQKAYNLARAGKEVKLEPKEVTVHSLQITAYRYPAVKFVADVSSGTYIRSLSEDIGAKLGTGAYLSALRRTSVGEYSVGQAVKVEDVTVSCVTSLDKSA